MKKSVHQHYKNCQVCAKHNIETQQLKNEHFSSPPQPMEFIAMELIEEFHPASIKGNRYALTAMCMLTGFTFCIPLKCTEDVIKAYINQTMYAAPLDSQEKSSQTMAPSSKTNYGQRYLTN